MPQKKELIKGFIDFSVLTLGLIVVGLSSFISFLAQQTKQEITKPQRIKILPVGGNCISLGGACSITPGSTPCCCGSCQFAYSQFGTNVYTCQGACPTNTPAPADTCTPSGGHCAYGYASCESAGRYPHTGSCPGNTPCCGDLKPTPTSIPQPKPTSTPTPIPPTQTPTPRPPTATPTLSCLGTCYFGYTLCSSIGRSNGIGACPGNAICCGELLPTSTPIPPTQTPTPTTKPTVIPTSSVCTCPHSCSPGSGSCWWGSGPYSCPPSCCNLGACPTVTPKPTLKLPTTTPTSTLTITSSSPTPTQSTSVVCTSSGTFKNPNGTCYVCYYSGATPQTISCPLTPTNTPKPTLTPLPTLPPATTCTSTGTYKLGTTCYQCYYAGAIPQVINCPPTPTPTKILLSPTPELFSQENECNLSCPTSCARSGKKWFCPSAQPTTTPTTRPTSTPKPELFSLQKTCDLSCYTSCVRLGTKWFCPPLPPTSTPIPKDKKICQPNTTKCLNEEILLTCNNEGTAWTQKLCPYKNEANIGCLSAQNRCLDANETEGYVDWQDWQREKETFEEYAVRVGMEGDPRLGYAVAALYGGVPLLANAAGVSSLAIPAAVTAAFPFGYVSLANYGLILGPKLTAAGLTTTKVATGLLGVGFLGQLGVGIYRQITGESPEIINTIDKISQISGQLGMVGATLGPAMFYSGQFIQQSSYLYLESRGLEPRKYILSDVHSAVNQLDDILNEAENRTLQGAKTKVIIPGDFFGKTTTELLEKGGPKPGVATLERVTKAKMHGVDVVALNGNWEARASLVSQAHELLAKYSDNPELRAVLDQTFGKPLDKVFEEMGIDKIEGNFAYGDASYLKSPGGEARQMIGKLDMVYLENGKIYMHTDSPDIIKYAIRDIDEAIRLAGGNPETAQLLQSVVKKQKNVKPLTPEEIEAIGEVLRPKEIAQRININTSAILNPTEVTEESLRLTIGLMETMDQDFQILQRPEATRAFAKALGVEEIGHGHVPLDTISKEIERLGSGIKLEGQTYTVAGITITSHDVRFSPGMRILAPGQPYYPVKGGIIQAPVGQTYPVSFYSPQVSSPYSILYPNIPPISDSTIIIGQMKDILFYIINMQPLTSQSQ